MIEKLDGFTRDGLGNVIGTEQDLVEGDVCRINGTTERRWYGATSVQPPPQDRVLSKTAFMDVCQTAFGGNGAGRARFGAIIRACSQSNDDEVRFVYERFQGATTFDKTVVMQLMTLLINKGTALVTPAVTAAERTAVSNNWPTG